MKSSSKKKAFLMSIFIALLICAFIYLFINIYYTDDKFRTMQDKISVTQEINLTSLRELQASGGRVPLFADLQKKLSHIKKKKIILDVRNELFAYINGMPEDFLNYHHDSPSVRHLPRRLFYTGTIKKRPELLISEKEEAQKYGFEYVNIGLGSKYTTPDENVDALISFFDNTSLKDLWIHFHCNKGKGRTSMALVLFDIIKNAPKVALKDIVKRQHLLGSVNLFDTKVWEGGSYTLEMLEARKKFIGDFYDFICQRKAGGIQRWSEWRHSQLNGGEMK
jgi:hypothetical protein